jgi:hypothetical protein
VMEALVSNPMSFSLLLWLPYYSGSRWAVFVWLYR